MRLRLPILLLAFTLASWTLLLLSSLSHTAEVAGLLGQWPRWTTIVAQAGFVLGVFLYERDQPSPLQGQDFAGLLRRLVRGPGLLAVACLALYLLERLVVSHHSSGSSTLFAIIYTINQGLFVVFLARTNYAWRTLVLFRASPRLRREWQWFELLLGASLLLWLFDWQPESHFRTAIITGMGLLGAYISSNQQWVAYLDRRQKGQAVLYQALLLAGVLVFVQYFRLTQRDPLLTAPEPQYAFLLLTAFFAAFYALMGLLVTIFNLPTAGVYEQRRAEILNLQRLTQIIQRGQSLGAIYRTLLESAVGTVQADAAWLELPPDNPTNETLEASDCFFEIPPPEATAISQQLAPSLHTNEHYLNNDLRARAEFRTVAQQYGSLVVLPLHSPQHQYGTLYLLKKQAQGFDRDDLGVLQTFASQTVLSLENLALTTIALQNQRTQEELKIASEVQDSLIPKKLPTDDWFEISTHSLAAKEVGGDFYDFLLLPGRRLAVLIGDVSGKGVTAAFHMAQMKGIFHALMQGNPLAKNDRDRFPLPSRFMTQANTALIHCLERSSFITSSLYIIDYEQGGFMFARAGHCHTLYYHALREEVFYFQSSGLGLGIIRNDSYEKHISNQFYDYGPGDVMVIYTDGIVEARGAGQQEYGEDRLKQRLEDCYYLDAEAIKDFILNDLNSFTTGQPIHDDQTLLVIKFKASQPELLA